MLKALKEMRIMICEQNENIDKEIEIIKEPNILELQDTITNLKKSLEGFNNWLEKVEEKNQWNWIQVI